MISCEEDLKNLWLPGGKKNHKVHINFVFIVSIVIPKSKLPLKRIHRKIITWDSEKKYLKSGFKNIYLCTATKISLGRENQILIITHLLEPLIANLFETLITFLSFNVTLNAK